MTQDSGKHMVIEGNKVNFKNRALHSTKAVNQVYLTKKENENFSTLNQNALASQAANLSKNSDLSELLLGK